MSKLFGTDGIRGEAGKFPLDVPTIERFGYALAMELEKRLGKTPLIILGRDTRESGEWIEAAVIRGIKTAAARYQSAGIITTPGVAYLTKILKADAGIVISASHNPFQDNGLKVFSPSGQKLDDITEQAIEADLRAEAEAFPAMSNTDTSRDTATEQELQQKYQSFLRTEMGTGLDLSGLHLVVDCANGASYRLAPALFQALGAEVTVINTDPNGRNINLDCGALHTEQLQAKVVETKADIGVAFDGDADRALFVDAQGNLVDGDQVLFIAAEYLAERNELEGNRVVATVMSNLGLELGLQQKNISLTRTNVGDKYVLDELLKNGGSIGGEQSGHVIFPKISLTGDGIITALEVLRVMKDSKQGLQELASGFTRYPQITINVKVGSKPPLDSIPPIKAMMDQLHTELQGTGRLLLRYSGTENLARVMIEGKDEKVIRMQAEAMAQVLRDHLL
ncbi:MAG: phosphoglucosamine mutase [Acidobacteria bacterium]|nr:phosphoglucosamine mutase [Acidobacteriota bacterium]